MSAHPDWIAPGHPVTVQRRTVTGRLDHEHTATIARTTPTLAILTTGDRYRRHGDTYVLTPRYLDYTITLTQPEETP